MSVKIIRDWDEDEVKKAYIKNINTYHYIPTYYEFIFQAVPHGNYYRTIFDELILTKYYKFYIQKD